MSKDKTLGEWLEKAKKDGLVKSNTDTSKKKVEKEVNAGSSPARKEYKEFTDEDGFKWVLTPRGLKFPIRTKVKRRNILFISFKGKRLHERFRDAYPEIQKWMNTLSKTSTTYHTYPTAFLSFCIDNDITPKEFGEHYKTREKEREAKRIVTAYIQSFMIAKPNRATQMMKASKSFYRIYSGGEVLSLDLKGALKIPLSAFEKTEKPQFAYGSRDEMREKLAHMIPIASRDLKDEMALIILYRTGVRNNVLNSLKIKDVQDRFTVEDPITKQPTEVLCLTITGDLDKKIRNYNFPRLLDAEGQPRGYYTYLAKDSLEMFDRFMQTYHRNSDLETALFSQPMGGNFVSHLILRFKNRLRKAGYPADTITLHQFRKNFSEVAHESVEDNKAEMLSGHLLKGPQEHYQKRNKIDLAKEYLKIKFTPSDSIEDLKQKFLEEQRERLAKEQRIGKLEVTIEKAGLAVPKEAPASWKPPTFTEVRPSLEEAPPIPTVSPVQQQKDDIHKIQERISEKAKKEEKKPIEIPLGPAPKACLRGLSFSKATDDSYCHELCARGYSSQYKACQEAKSESPELFI